MAITAQVGKIPGTVSTVVLEDGATVADALRAAGFSHEAGYALRVDGQSGTVDQAVREGGTIFLAKESKSA